MYGRSDSTTLGGIRKMNKQTKALAAAFAAFIASLFAVFLGTEEVMVLNDAFAPVGVAIVTWLGTWFSPANGR